MCQRCGLHLTDLVDHIVPAGVAVQQAIDSGLFKWDRYAGFFIKTNLQGLCRQCHYTKTEEDKQHVGQWPNVITLALQKPKRLYVF